MNPTDDTDEASETEPVPTIGNDIFAAVLALVTLVNDKHGTAARIRSLQEREAAALRAEASLAAAKSEHDAAVAKERAALAEEKAQLDERRRKLAALEGRLQSEQEIISRRQSVLDARRYRKLGASGLVQDLGEPSLPAADPHFPEPQSDDPWFAPTAGSTVTRTTTGKEISR
jgi:hypothetical protein